MTIDIPNRDPDRPQDDPWDADAVRFLLGQPDGARWTRGTLMEALRRQPRIHRQRIDEAARLAAAHGVEQIEEPRGGRTIVHFYRTDPAAPSYPRDADHRRQLLKHSPR